jgi:hypothetical protein
MSIVRSSRRVGQFLGCLARLVAADSYEPDDAIAELDESKCSGFGDDAWRAKFDLAKLYHIFGLTAKTTVRIKQPIKMISWAFDVTKFKFIGSM